MCTYSQITSIVLLNLPHNAQNDANADIYLSIWWVSSVPRVYDDMHRLLKYSSESVVDPKITRNVKRE
jgi:hypothetical protein